jgi:hypothetical protein
VTRYHCYIEYRESVYAEDVEAGTAVDAAAAAAGKCRIHGRWTVVPGEPVYVDVVEHTTYEATPAGPES